MGEAKDKRDTSEPFTEVVGPGGATSGSVRLLAPGSRLGARYEVRGVLGRGGFAVVYLAWDRTLKREVALKVLRADRLGDSGLTRFRREAAVARDAASPRLVRIFDIGSAEGAVFLVMERIKGESLAQRLAREGALPLEEALGLAQQVLEGLAALHQLSIVHRDIKPGNVLITFEGEVKVADFGLARRWEGDETRATETLALVGSIDYLAPEQALGQPVDARTDLYAFGILLYEMLSGQLPYPRGSGLGRILSHLGRPPRDLRRARPEVPRWLARVVARLLEKRPEDRYPSAAAVLRDLERRGSSLLATRRRRALVAAGALAAALTAGALPLAQRWSSEAPEISHLTVLDPELGVEVVGAGGEVLWRLPDVPPTRVGLARLEPDGARRVVAFLDAGPEAPPERSHRLSVVGEGPRRPLLEAVLPTGSHFFPEFSPRLFRPEPFVFDIDGDGRDEVLATFNHIYWPSFTVLYEPLLQRSRLVLVAGGHHRPVAAVDLDGNGEPEILFHGFANRMGWHYAVAAVRLTPRVNREPGRAPRVAFTPDLHQPRREEQLLWYALLPATTCGEPRCLEVDETRQHIRIDRGGNEPRLILDFAGFPVDASTPAPGVDRQRLRWRAYETLRRAQIMLESGEPHGAPQLLAEALEAASASGDPHLPGWIQRVEAQALAATGRLGEAESRFEELLAAAPRPGDVLFEAGRAFHLAGDPERAVRWYRREISREAIGWRGRQQHDVLMGLAFALGELGLWEEALADLERFARFGGAPSDAHRLYVLWRRGLAVRLPDLPAGAIDRERYWHLEARLARGQDVRQLHSEVEAELELASRTTPVLLSLQAECLRRLGRPGEALETARTAYEETRMGLHRDTFLRAHFEVVAGRLAALLHEAGEGAEAARVESALTEWPRAQAVSGSPRPSPDPP